MVFQRLEVQLAANASQLTSGIDEAIGSLDALGKKAGVVGGALTALSAGGIAKSIGAFSRFEESIVELEKVASEDVAAALQDDIRQMATETRLTSGEIAELAAQASRFGAEGTDEIREFTRVAAEMGAATTLASDEAGRSLAKVSTALGEPLDNARQLGDAINEVSNNFASSSQEIVDSTSRAGATLSELGLSTDEIIGLSGSMNEVADSSQLAAGMMRRLGEEMLDPDNVSVFADALGVTSEEFEEMRDSAPNETLRELAQAAEESDEVMTLFREELGKRGARAFSRYRQNVEQTADAQSTANQAIEEGGSLAEENQKDMDTFAGQMAALKAQLNDIAIGVGQNLTPALVVLNNVIRGALERFQDFNRSLGGAPATIALVGGLITGLVIILGTLSTFITAAIVPGLATLAGAFTSAGAAALGAVPGTSAFAGAVNLAALPVSLIIGLILALVGVLGLLATNFAGFRDRWFNVLQKWKAGTVDAIRALQNGFISMWETVVNSGVDARNSIAEIVNGMIQNINRLLDAIPRVESELNEVGMAAEREFERVDRVADEELMEGGRFETREVGSGEDLTGLTDRFGDLFETPDPEDIGAGEGDDGGEVELPDDAQSPEEEDTKAAKEQTESVDELLDNAGDGEFAPDVSPEDVMPGAETGGGTSTGGTTGTPSAGRPRTSTGGTSGSFEITLTNVPALVDDDATRDLVRQVAQQILNQAEKERLGDQRRQGAARR